MSSNRGPPSDEKQSGFTDMPRSQKEVLKAIWLEAETQYSYVSYQDIMSHTDDKIAFRREIGHLVMNDFIETTNAQVENDRNAKYYLTDKGLEAVKEIL